MALRGRAACTGCGSIVTGWVHERLPGGPVPDNIAYGATGGPEFATTVVATGSGHEKRNVNWAQARGRWDVASGLKKQSDIDELIAFYRARRGRAYSGLISVEGGSHRAPRRCSETGRAISACLP
jgi:hypothetical protein